MPWSRVLPGRTEAPYGPAVLASAASGSVRRSGLLTIMATDMHTPSCSRQPCSFLPLQLSHGDEADADDDEVVTMYIIEQGPPCFRVALEPDAKFEIDIFFDVSAAGPVA